MVFASVPGWKALMPMVLVEERGCGEPVAEAPTRAIVWPWRLRTESSLDGDERIAADPLAAQSGPSGRMRQYHGDGLNRSDVALVTLIRSPVRLPQRTWTASSSPRLMRCITVWRETPRRWVAWIMGT